VQAQENGVNIFHVEVRALR